MGRDRFPDADRILITADAGGSNGYRLRAWKVELARLAAGTGLRITVCHYPPGTSKWNRIEHRMFNFIIMNWRGKPLTSLRTIIELISPSGRSVVGTSSWCLPSAFPCMEIPMTSATHLWVVTRIEEGDGLYLFEDHEDAAAFAALYDDASVIEAPVFARAGAAALIAAEVAQQCED